MQSKATQLIIIMCASLLFMQWNGLHIHVSLNGDHDGMNTHLDTLHFTHIHDIDSDGHSHEGEVDISFSELNTIWAKLLAFLLAIVFLLFALANISQVTWLPPLERKYCRWRYYLRPILRAPPLIISK